MIVASDLIATARYLLKREIEPSEADARRAVSTLYYAMFHELARSCADLFAGDDENDRSKYAWRQVYRCLVHKRIADQCNNGWFLQSDFPVEIKRFATEFVSVQTKRHKCDYDPYYVLDYRSIEPDIKQVEKALEVFNNVSASARRAFAIWILLESKAEDRQPLPVVEKGKKGNVAGDKK